MTPDDYLERLLDAVEKSNWWDIEAYAQIVLDKIHHVKSEFRPELKGYLENLIAQAKEQSKKQRAKDDLIDQIMRSNKK